MRTEICMAPRSRGWIAICLAGVILLQSVSCGTILHPERRGFRSDRLDPAIVALDAVGLLFFFVPGVIAFAVDFSTGAIYLPPDEFSTLPNNSQSHHPISPAAYCPAPYNHDQIALILRQETGKTVDLRSPAVQVVRLKNLDELSSVAIHAAHHPGRFNVGESMPVEMKIEELR